MEKLFNIIIALALILMVTPAMAQGAPPVTPIDGGLSLLLAAGATYGAKKLYDSRKQD